MEQYRVKQGQFWNQSARECRETASTRCFFSSSSFFKKILFFPFAFNHAYARFSFCFFPLSTIKGFDKWKVRQSRFFCFLKECKVLCFEETTIG